MAEKIHMKIAKTADRNRNQNLFERDSFKDLKVYKFLIFSQNNTIISEQILCFFYLYSLL
jgi:hypothetical protein